MPPTRTSRVPGWGFLFLHPTRRRTDGQPVGQGHAGALRDRDTTRQARVMGARASGWNGQGRRRCDDPRTAQAPPAASDFWALVECSVGKPGVGPSGPSHSPHTMETQMKTKIERLYTFTRGA